MKYLVLLFLLVIVILPLKAQIEVEGTPKSLSYRMKAEIPKQTMPAIDLATLQAEDELDDLLNVPYRFAETFKVNYNLDNSGDWENLSDGGRVWRLKIACPDALSINFLYDDFFIPEGGEFYIYDESYEQVIGAMGAHNNRPSRKFATRLLWSDVAILEYYEPASARGKSAISIAQVAHGYRDFPETDESNNQLGNGGSCQVNVNCSPEGDNWQTEKRSVAKIIIDGSGLCTGALINNSAQDCTPYFLTADHCINDTYDAVTNPSATQFVFYWNFERTGCDNTGSVDDTQTTVGATVLATPSSTSASATSDFALLELTTNPANSYNVYFAGFDASGASGTGGVGIHHPRGDAKKIATHSITPTTVVNNNYWRIYWDQTTNGWSVTEGGSSGSPLFNNNGYIIGQLFGGFLGGQPNCTDPGNDEGDYGKMSVSWTNGGDINSRRLDVWLDPIGLGANTVVNGSSDPCSVAFNDLCSNAPLVVCGNTIDGTTNTASNTDTPSTTCGTTSSGTETGVWYRIIGTGDVVTASTCSGTNFDTKIQVFTGTCGNFTCVDGNDDACSTQSTVTFCTESGTTYYIFVYGSGTTAGDFDLSVTCAADGDAPTIVCPSNTTVDTDLGQCSAVVNYSATISDICGIQSTSYSQNSGTAFSVGTTTVTVSATDVNNNATSCSFDVTVNDNEAPTMMCNSFDLNLMGASVSITTSQMDGGSTDNCGIIAFTANPSTFTCSTLGAQMVTLTAFDAAGNSASCNGTVTVIDNNPPTAVCANPTVNLTSDGTTNVATSLFDGGSSTVCGGFTLSASQTAFDCSDVGNVSVTLTVTAVDNGQTATCTANVTVADPQSFCCAAANAVCNNTTVQLDAGGSASIVPADVGGGSTAECGLASEMVSQMDFSCADVNNPVAVTYTIEDINGATSSCNATVTVEDNIAPTPVCKTTTVELTPEGIYNVTLNDIFDLGASDDNCGITSTSFVSTSYDCDDLGQTFNIDVTAGDAGGNQVSCTATVTVDVGDALPSGWEPNDIGSGGVLGNDLSFDPCANMDGEFSITGGGMNNMTSTTDDVAFASQYLCGQNVSITAKVESVDPNGYGGLMIRETTADGAKQVAVYSSLSFLLRHETRYTTNGVKQVSQFFKPSPVWLRLERQGSWIFAYYSQTGMPNTFQYVHAVFVPMNNCVEIGLASFTYNPVQQTTTVFSNVSISGASAPNATVPGITEETVAKFQQGVNLYPNPANNIVNITFEDGLATDAIVTLRNQLGQVIEQRELRAGDFTSEWNVSTLTNGLYLFEIRQESGQVEVLRLVKTK